MLTVFRIAASVGSRTSPEDTVPVPVLVVAADARIGAAAAIFAGSVIATLMPVSASRVGRIVYWSPVAIPAPTTMDKPSARIGSALVPVPVKLTVAPVSCRRSVYPVAVRPRT